MVNILLECINGLVLPTETENICCE